MNSKVSERAREMGERRTVNFGRGLRSGGGSAEEEKVEKTKTARDQEVVLSGEDPPQISRRVPRASLLKCLSCPLCDRLCRDASTIVECLHTFCSACLRKMLKDGRTTNVCPKCNTDLGCHPFQLVRQDRLLSTIQLKLFPAGVVRG